MLAKRLGHSVPTLENLAQIVQSGPSDDSYRLVRGDRELRVPTPQLKVELLPVAEYLRASLPRPAEHVHGFVKKKSILTNAKEHLGAPVVLRLDLRNFFASIQSDMVHAALTKHASFTDDAAHLLVAVCVPEGRLPLGFSTSPALSNLVFDETDRALETWASANHVALTRYVDDIAVSGHVDDRHLEDLTGILNEHHWVLNETKTLFMRRGRSQYVTGLSVSDPLQARVPRALKRRMRAKLFLMEKHGFDAYMKSFGGDDRGECPQQLLGHARYIAMVEPKLGGMLLRRFSLAIEESAYAGDPEEGWEAWALDL